MAYINRTDRYFGYRTLDGKGRCCVCSKDIPKGKEKVIRIRVGRGDGSLCKDCCEIIHKVSQGETFGYDVDEDFDNYI